MTDGVSTFCNIKTTIRATLAAIGRLALGTTQRGGIFVDNAIPLHHVGRFHVCGSFPAAIWKACPREVIKLSTDWSKSNLDIHQGRYDTYIKFKMLSLIRTS